MTGDSRRKIIEGVWQVIAEHGITQVSMRSVAAAAGVSLGRVQHHFGTKTELVRASVTEMLAAAQEAHPPAAGSPDEAATVHGLLTHSLEPAASSRHGVGVFYAYVAASVNDPWIAEQLAAAKRGQIDLVATCLARQNPTLTLPSNAARDLVALADGYTQAVYLGYCSADEARGQILTALTTLTTPTHGGSSHRSPSNGPPSDNQCCMSMKRL